MAAWRIFPSWILGPILYARFLMFAFGGIELIGMTAAEAENSEKVFHKPLTKLFSEFWFLRGFAGNYYVAYSMESTGPWRFR